MSDKEHDNHDDAALSAGMEDGPVLQKIDARRFDMEMERLIEESEDMRMKRMMQHRSYGFLSMNLSILSVFLGVGGFGWYFFVETNLPLSFLCILVSIIPPIFLNVLEQAPLKAYRKEHKAVFMPKLAKTLNGLAFYPDRGISSKILERLVVLPPYRIYDAEDCFMGTYKGVKVMFSEARLYAHHKRNGPDFDGIFVLLETPDEVFEGHTIITADRKMAQKWEKTRWKKLGKVYISIDNPEWDKFLVYSTKPETAELFVGERLIKELAEASEIFDNSPLTAVMFGKKYVFMMIPYDKDMFEASSMFVPITTRQHALQCKKEIEQLLEIIDVFDLYKPIEG